MAPESVNAAPIDFRTEPKRYKHWKLSTENGVAYLTIRSPTPDRLVSVSSPVAKKAELHTMEMAGMVMKMRPLAALTSHSVSPSL